MTESNPETNAKTKPETKRVNFSMSMELFRYFKAKADAMGVPYTNLLVMALSEYRDQRESISVMSNVMDTLGKGPSGINVEGAQAMAGIMEMMGKMNKK